MFLSVMRDQKMKQMKKSDAKASDFFCKETRKRCVSVGKKAKKVRNFMLHMHLTMTIALE